jgi:CBS-domain-containing membrane protein
MAEDRAREYVKGHGRHAREVMTHDVATVAEDASLAEIAELLEERRIKRVPVVRDGRLVGIVSRANLLHGLATTREAAPAAPSEDDRAIRLRVVATLEDDLGLTTECINVIVRAGVVELWGVVDGAEEKRAILLATENTPGVQEIRDHVSVPTQSIRSLNWGL